MNATSCQKLECFVRDGKIEALSPEARNFLGEDDLARVAAAQAAAFDDGVKDGATLSGLGSAEEEVVFTTDGGGADTILGSRS